ncbi:5'(3')-nucleotidase/polyphosphatase [Methylophaga lonarensis MPL]|uniref:5'-nucleotidase SurE n=1 Tax=Methylophaga lonarensis MPL TaxID=1286106 RepID=M7PTX0_9GAMM|nr:5'/3'-nucleotidase SurE [Methylophaga lonarensis]EMR13909.1 5'(3')-nucleotidase/polyphosphatase [Methylophaga lonarensis MPL]
MKILISNDDGYMARGIQTLARALSEMGEITVVAPDRNRSGASNSLTLENPLRLDLLDNGVYRVEGTPTDCVHLAITGLLEEEPDMVVSGINAGANLGDDVLYSGTVAAAMEGRFLGLPAIAISLVGHDATHYETAGWVAQQLVARLKASALPADTILNVNVPDLPIDQITGFESTRLGHRHKAEPVIKEYDPRGRPMYWIGPAGEEEDAGPGTDFDAIRRGAVSVTPLQIDLTRYDAIDGVAKWLAETVR